jgi:hypothetical protein
MKKLFTVLLFLPLCVIAQNDGCGAVGYSAFGGIVIPNAQAGTAVGFELSRLEPLNHSSIYAGLGVEAVRILPRQWALPLSLRLAVITSPASISPVFLLSPGYNLLPGGGLTLSGSAGLVVLNACFTVGFSQYRFAEDKASGVTVRVGVLF